MPGVFFSLFCHQCDKTLHAREEELVLVRSQEPDAFKKEDDRLHYRGGCFFKTAARLCREKPSRSDSSER